MWASKCIPLRYTASFHTLAGVGLHVIRYIWTEQYEAAVFEVDSAIMKDRATKAEELIEERREELLRQASRDATELQAVTKALAVLTVLKGIADKQTRF